jgi:hypothetical protein
MPGEHKIEGLQKKAIWSTAHILQEVLFSKYKTYFRDEKTFPVAQIVNTVQLQHYIS